MMGARALTDPRERSGREPGFIADRMSGVFVQGLPQGKPRPPVSGLLPLSVGEGSVVSVDSNGRVTPVGDNTTLSGRLPMELTGLRLARFYWHGTDLCSPPGKEFQEWLARIFGRKGMGKCAS